MIPVPSGSMVADEREEISGELALMGVNVEFIGKMIADLINDG